MSVYNEKSKAYSIQYEKEKLKRIPLNVQKEEYEIIKAAADRAGLAVNSYIKLAIREKLNREELNQDESE